MSTDPESPPPQSPIREYVRKVLRLWGIHISGPLLALITLVLGFAAAHYANDAQTGMRLVRWSAYITGAASTFLIFVAQYDVWKTERIALEAERVKNVGSDIRGEIRRGYLEHRKAQLTHVAGGTKYQWVAVPAQFCYVYFLIDAVNCNDATATLRPDLSSVGLTINGRTFHGKCSPIPLGLGVNDDYRKVKQIRDAFAVSPLCRAFPWMGELGFLIEDFDGRLTEEKDAVLASVKIKVVDSVKKTHELENNNLLMLIGRLGIMGEEIKY